MSLGVDAYLAWTPGGMSGAADWLKLKSELMDQSARSLRDAADRGTENQSGQFITSRRQDAADHARRIDELADLLLEASRVVRQAGTALESAVRRLGEVDAQLREEGYERVAGERVGDRRSSYEDAADKQTREARADEFGAQIGDLLQEIRDADDQANRDLHSIVGRDVRDRTAAGNGDPFAVRLSTVSIIGAVTSAATSVVEGRWKEAVLASGRGMTMAKGLGPVMAGLGFIGGVAARPEDEPLHEAIVAEGVGTVAGAGGLPLGFAAGFSLAGPPGGVLGGAVGIAGGTYASALASAEVRKAFDRAN